LFKTEPIRDLMKIKEMQDYLKENNFRDYCMFVIGTNVGFRISDLLEFKVGTIRGKERIVIKEEKTAKIRHQKIPRDLRAFIEDVTADMDDSDYLFRSRQKKIKSNERGKPLAGFRRI
jgi:integrase